MRAKGDMQAVMADAEKWPLQFSSPSRAVAWADSFLLQPRVESQFGKIVRQSVERKELSAMDAHGQLITSDRLRDLAETISVCLSAVPNPAGTLYRHVHGRHPHTLQTADQLALLVWDGPGPRGTRTIAKMRVLAALQIESARRKAQRGKGIKTVDIAQQMRIKRDCYYDNWQGYAELMQEHIRQWLDRADRELTTELTEKGVL